MTSTVLQERNLTNLFKCMVTKGKGTEKPFLKNDQIFALNPFFDALKGILKSDFCIRIRH